MNLKKPKFWDYPEPNYISNLLLPISKLVQLLTVLKKKQKNKLDGIKTICVGNIYVGGTGKTPASIFLAEELAKNKKRPAIVRKYYENYEDEQNLIKSNFSDLILGKTRSTHVVFVPGSIVSPWEIRLGE